MVEIFPNNEIFKAAKGFIGVHGNLIILDNLIQFINGMAIYKYPHLVHHTSNVEELSFLLARKANFQSDQLQSLKYAALLHDIGKIAIKDSIINKKTSLSNQEVLMIKKHPALGNELIQYLKVDPLIGLNILHHHENYDGSGYPSGLVGKDIPFAARIIRIVDTYDALINDRPYRSGYSSDEAIEIMKINYKTFDPHLLQCFFEMIVNGQIVNN